MVIGLEEVARDHTGVVDAGRKRKLAKNCNGLIHAADARPSDLSGLAVAGAHYVAMRVNAGWPTTLIYLRGPRTELERNRYSCSCRL